MKQSAIWKNIRLFSWRSVFFRYLFSLMFIILLIFVPYTMIIYYVSDDMLASEISAQSSSNALKSKMIFDLLNSSFANHYALAADSTDAAAFLSAESTLVITYSPNAFAMGMITLASPLAPACMRSVSPAAAPPSIKRLRYAVANASGRQAASSNEMFSGAGMTISAGAATSSAYPPPGSSAHTRSPTRHRPAAAGVTALMKPATSSPGQSGQPGGGG